MVVHICTEFAFVSIFVLYNNMVQPCLVQEEICGMLINWNFEHEDRMISEYWCHKNVKGSSCGQIWATDTTLTWRYWGKPQKFKFTVTGLMDEIRTLHLQHRK